MNTQEEQRAKETIETLDFEVGEDGSSIKVISASSERCRKSLTPKEIREILSEDVYQRLEKNPHRIIHLFETILDADGQNSSVNFLSSHFQCNGIGKTVDKIKKNLLGKI